MTTGSVPDRIYFKNQIVLIATLLASLFCLTGFWRGEPSWEKIHADIDAKYPDVPSISMAELMEKMATDTDLTLIDVRSREEYAVSHIQKAIQMTSPTDLALALDRYIVCYCSVGYRSAEFVHAARNLGYTNIVNYKGSIFEWANAGKPVHRDGKVVSKVHPYNDYWGQLLNSNLHYRKTKQP